MSVMLTPEERKARKKERARTYYLKDPARWIAHAKEWQVANPDKVRISSRRWKARQVAAGANRAYLIVHRAIQRGQLTRPTTCEQCGQAGRIEAAHFDYSQPLRVRWLCRSCHVLWDRDPKLPHPH